MQVTDEAYQPLLRILGFVHRFKGMKLKRVCVESPDWHAEKVKLGCSML